MEAPLSPGMAVSGLMQQLKSGEISKMQLFQQLAKLQVASAGGSTEAMPSPAPPTMDLHKPSLMASTGFRAPPSNPRATIAPSTPSGLLFAGSSPGSLLSSGAPLAAAQPPPVPMQFSFGAAVVPTPFPMRSADAAASFSMKTSVQDTLLSVPTSAPSKSSATLVQSDADFLATGVSHEKAQRFSVQEWMANKTRASASSQVSNALRLHYQQQSQAQAAELAVAVQPHDQPWIRREDGANDAFGASGYERREPQQHILDMDDPLTGLGSANLTRDSVETRHHSYVYTPRHRLSGQSQYVDGLNYTEGRDEQEYIDFVEHFRDDLEDDHDRGVNSSQSGGKSGGKGGVTAGSRNNNTDGKFHARVTRWKSQKDAIREQMKQQLLQSELSECTFAPKINPKSTKVAAKLRGRQLDDATNDAVSASLAVSERLYQEADNYRTREELAAKLKVEEEAEIERECTFKPKINRTDKVKAKYMEITTTPSPSLTAASREAAARELAECTFYPKVNGISAEMASAQLYLQQDIYERLSRPCVGSEADGSPAKGRRGRRRSLSLFGDDDEDRDSLDVSSPRSSRSQDDISVRPGGTSRRRRSSSGENGQGPRSVGGSPSREDKEARVRQFKNFIERQKFHEQARHKRIELTKQQLTPGYKPAINKKSLAMMENGRKGDFLERISTYALRKEHNTVRKKTVRSTDPNCTFKPAINQTSVKRKARSITELSRGDLLRRETSQRLMKLKMEQEEMAALTFRPQLNRVSERHEGKLKILSSPDTYLQRIQQQSQAHTIKQRRALQEKEMGEFAECTFKPRTIEAPAYVQRIARSVSLTRALRAQQRDVAKTAEKPEWK